MKEVNYSKDDLTNRFSKNDDLGKIIGDLESDFFSKSQLVCQVSVNGLSLSEEDEYRLKGTVLDEIDRITLHIENAEILKMDLMKNWDQLIPSIVRLAEQLAENIRFEGLEKSYKSFVDLIEACQFLVSSLDSFKSVMNAQEKQTLSSSWVEDEKKLGQLTSEIFHSFEAKNENLLADLIEYELIGNLQNWKVLIGEFINVSTNGVELNFESSGL